MSFEELWRSDEPMYGGWITTASSLNGEMLGRSGFDWMVVDVQHGFMGTEGMLRTLQVLSAAGAETFVRPEWHDPGPIMKALDAGARGVMIPMVSNVEEATNVAGASRYPPAGYRSFGPTRAQFGERPYRTDEANSSVRCLVMIETLDGVDSIDEILSVPGVDGAFVGPSDLSLAAGYEPRMDCDEPDHVERVMAVLDSCIRHGAMPGIYAGRVDLAIRWREAGFRMIALASDSGVLSKGVRAALKAIRSESH